MTVNVGGTPNDQQLPEDAAALAHLWAEHKANREVDFLRTKFCRTINGVLELPVIHATSLRALILDRDGELDAATAVMVKHARIVGDLRLTNSEVPRLFSLCECDWSTGTVYLNFAHLRSFFLDGTTVRFVDATRSQIEGTAYLRNGFKALAGVNLSGCWVRGNLSLRGATLMPGCGSSSKRARVETVQQAKEPDAYALRLVDARVSGRLMFDHAREDEDDRKFPTRLLGSCELRGLEVAEFLDGESNYEGLEAGQRGSGGDAVHGVPREVLGASRLYLDGFTYSRLSIESPQDWEFRVRWLRSFRPANDPAELKHFRAQPYTQLARALQDVGREDDAKAVLIERRRRQYHATALVKRAWPVRWSRAVLEWVYDFTARYGYKPERLHAGSLALIAVTWILLSLASGYGLMAPQSSNAWQLDWWKRCSHVVGRPPQTMRKALALAPTDMEMCLESRHDSTGSIPDYPRMRPLIYAIDAYLPVVDLNHEHYWVPAERTQWGRYLSWYLVVLRVAGWIYASLTIGSLFSRLTKRGEA